MDTTDRQAVHKPVASAKIDDAPKPKSFWSQVRRYLPKYFI